MIFLPFTLSSLVALLTKGRYRVGASEWLPLGQKIAAVLVPFSLVYPFWFQKLTSRNSDLMRARGKDPEETVLLVATALSAQPSVYTFVLFLLGGPAKHAYYASVLSIVGALYWAWRYRHIYSELQV